MKELLKTLDLSVGYDGTAVAGPFDFPIYKGEVLTLIGPNGAGKTTLLKTLARQLAPVAGTVLLDEEDLNVTKPLELAKRIDEVMEQVHVTELQDRPFTAISDGQRQRVVLARALCQQPEIILLDEPTTFLDIRWKAEFLEALKDLSETQNKTVLMTLHEPELARLVSDRVACIREGRLDRLGSPGEVFEGRYIAHLFGLDETLYDKWFT